MTVHKTPPYNQKPNSPKEKNKNFKNKKDSPAVALTNVNAEVNTSLDFKKISRDIRRLTLAERTVLDLMFVSDEAIKFYEKDIKYFYNEIYRTIANFVVEQFKTSGSFDFSTMLTEANALDIKNKEEVLSEISAISFRKDKETFR